MTTDESRGSQLREASRVLRRGTWWILAFVVLVVGSTLVHSVQRAPVYLSSAEVIVRPAAISPAARSAYVHLQTEHRIAGSVAVAELAHASLQARGLAPGGVAVEPLEPQTLRFRAVARSPKSAMATAQAYAEAYLSFRQNQVTADLRAVAEPLTARSAELGAQIADILDRFSSSTDGVERKTLEDRMYSLVRLQTLVEQERNGLPAPETISVGTVVRPASLPRSPTSPNHVRSGSLAAVVGLAFGVGAALIVDRRDDRFPSRAALVDLLAAPVLAVVPQLRRKRARHGSGTLVVEPASEAGEAYGALRKNLEHALDSRAANSVLVTAARRGDGVTTTTANLAAALARAGRRVVVVSAACDAGIERSLAQVAEDSGLSAGLLGRSKASAALLPSTVDGVRVLAACRGERPGGEGLDAATVRTLLADLAGGADVVLVDGPSLLDEADSLVLASAVDAVMVVANARRTTTGTVWECRTQLRQVGAFIVGSVLNEADPRRRPPEPDTRGPIPVDTLSPPRRRLAARGPHRRIPGRR